MFGGLPFLFGIQFATSEDGSILFLLGEIAVWTGAFLITLLAQQALRRVLEPFLNQEVLLILFGGSFLLTGVAVMSFLTRVDRTAGLLTGGILALVGAAIFGFGLRRLLKSTR
jgi:drug/metabolite transporter superfamily protein YnfA